MPATPDAPAAGPAGFPVCMVCDPIPESPRVAFPDGYSIRRMTAADIPTWTAVQQDAEPYYTIGDGMFVSQFGPDLELAWERCFLVTAPDGTAVGTISAWEDAARFGSLHGRLHWLAIPPAHARRGLAKAASSFVMEIFRQRYSRAFLDTQSLRIPAIHLYRGFGFRPVIQSEHDRTVWREIAQAEQQLFPSTPTT